MIELMELRVNPKIENNFEMDKQILKLFKNNAEFIDKQSLDDLIKYIEEEILSKIRDDSEELQKFKRDLIVHGRINLLLITILARNPEAFSQVLEKYGYKPFFYNKGFNPFRAALEIKDGRCLEVIADYLENNDTVRHAFVTHSTFVKAMNTSNTHLKTVFSETFLSPPHDLEWTKIPQIVQFPLKSSLYDASYSNSNYYEHSLRDSVEASRRSSSKATRSSRPSTRSPTSSSPQT